MSKWKMIEYDWALDLFYFGENPYWWGAVNSENCNSANNKRCLLAICRSKKNQKRRIKMIKHMKRVHDINKEYGCHIIAHNIFGYYY